MNNRRKSRRKGKNESAEIKRASESGKRIVRTTVFFKDVLKQNLSCLALMLDVTEGEIIQKALEEYVRGRGLDPTKKPTLKVTYGGKQR